MIQPIYNELGWNEKNSENENYTNTQLRPLILSMACKVGNQNCLSFAGQLFRSWKEEGTQISPDLRTVVYSYGKSNFSPIGYNSIDKILKSVHSKYA